MRGKVARLIKKIAGDKYNKRKMKKIYNDLNFENRGKFNSSLKLFIKTKNESSV